MKHKIALITLCYNETKIIPFVIDYWKKFVTHAYVFDNGSTDESREELSKHDWITVIDYSHLTGNKLDDIINMNIKNNFWKTIANNYDWIVVCDFDECLYCDNWDGILTILEQYNATYIIPKYYNMISENFPEYEEEKLFHEKYNTYENLKEEDKKWFNKMLLFNCKTALELNLAPGSHTCSPTKLWKDIYQTSIQIHASQPAYIQQISCYHLCWLGKDFVVNKFAHNRDERQTEKQMKYRFGSHYMYENEKIANDFDERWNNHLTL